MDQQLAAPVLAEPEILQRAMDRDPLRIGLQRVLAEPRRLVTRSRRELIVRAVEERPDDARFAAIGRSRIRRCAAAAVEQPGQQAGRIDCAAAASRRGAGRSPRRMRRLAGFGNADGALPEGGAPSVKHVYAELTRP